MSKDPSPFDLPYTAGSYTLVKELGAGAFCYVYKATKVGDIEFYAIKVMNKSGLKDKRDEQHFQNELDSMFFLKHENIISMLDFYSDEEYFYIVLDYCAGGSLDDYIVKNGPLRESIAAGFFYQIVSAIQFCHQHGVAHRDLKPANILITQFPNIKVTDFGLAGLFERDEKLTTFCGSPCFASPECLKRIPYDGKLSDLWGLGIILYEMVTGTHPWHVSNFSKMVKDIQNAQYIPLPPEITPSCSSLIHDLLKVKPTERLTPDKILSHPWMRLATSRIKTGHQYSSLPPLAPISLLQFNQSIDRSQCKSDHGIYNPLESSVPLVLSHQASIHRSMSTGKFGNPLRKSSVCLLQTVKHKDGPGSGSRRPAVPRIPTSSKKVPSLI